MSLIVAFTAGAGFLSSVLLQTAGMQRMWLRYALCIAIAYAVFILLIGLWRRWREWDLSFDLPGSSPGYGSSTQSWSGQGGSSGGGGASASFEGVSLSTPIESVDAPDLPDLPDVDIGEGIWLLPLLLIATGMLIAVAWLIWVAPVLLAEVAVDAALSAGLYRRLRHSEAEDWFFATLRHTWKPFLLAGICAVIVGALLGYLAPEATTLGEALSYLA